jgi:lipopolysaccharide transport system permease protein
MFATPIVYPASVIGEKYRWLILANPFASIVETFRYACLGKGSPEPLSLAASLLLLLILLIIGVTVYLRAARTFVDTV